MNVPNTIDDFVKLLGQPDQIRISFQKPADAEYVQYAVYFSSRKVMIGVLVTNWTGPEPTDIVYLLWLNTDFINNPPFNWGEIQPWLGYGHIKEYLPDIEIPKDATP